MAAASNVPASFSYFDRDSILNRMNSETFDLVVVGGGITGAGVARDATSRGMKVALIEARDFAEGTSSRSSKLIHGGIRYLENLEFGLVFEALSERKLLFEIAPHLVHPLRFVLPLYRGGRVGMLKMGLGMWLYDALSMFEAPEMHERLSPHETMERLPLLKEKDLLGSYVYSDAYMDDARLVIETLRSAVKKGAACLNRVSADGAEMTDGKVSAVFATDHLSGRKLKIRARHVISTVGPWTDLVAPKLLGQWHKILRLSKGVHLTFDRRRLHLNQAVVMASDQDKRIVFGIPRHEMTIVGTTDTDYPNDPADVSATPEDVRYLLKIAAEYFPGAQLTDKDIIASYAGVRPLVDDGAETESKTSREHLIQRDPRNVTFVAGGKYTTYRLMAQQTVEAALEAFSLEDQVRFNNADTKIPLNELATQSAIDNSLRFVAEMSRDFQIDKRAVEELIYRHGGEAVPILGNLGKLSFSGEESAMTKLWMLEAHHSLHQTMCLDLVDFYARRTMLFLAQPDHGLLHIEPLSRVFAAELGWDESRRHSEALRLRQYIQQELNWRKSFL
jgi:glycerol-3-phosphate dehydrogenase